MVASRATCCSAKLLAEALVSLLSSAMPSLSTLPEQLHLRIIDACPVKTVGRLGLVNRRSSVIVTKQKLRHSSHAGTRTQALQVVADKDVESRSLHCTLPPAPACSFVCQGNKKQRPLQPLIVTNGCADIVWRVPRCFIFFASDVRRADCNDGCEHQNHGWHRTPGCGGL